MIRIGVLVPLLLGACRGDAPAPPARVPATGAAAEAALVAGRLRPLAVLVQPVAVRPPSEPVDDALEGDDDDEDGEAGDGAEGADEDPAHRVVVVTSVVDVFDTAPAAPEAEPDRDVDGVLDVEDRCPDPEDGAQREDVDGC